MSSNVNSRNSPSGGNGSGSNILSEQKRRQAIRQGFDRLAAMTPGMVRD
jgi:hypothetical protein